MAGTVKVATTNKAWMSFALAGSTGTSGGEIGAVLNPEGHALIIARVILYVVTASTGAANINVGVAADANTSDSSLISALAINGSIAGYAYNGPAPAAKAQMTVLTGAQYITCTGSADSTGFVGNLFVQYIHAVTP
jgi:hypothetical protein